MNGIKYIVVGVLSLGFLGVVSSIHIDMTDTFELVCPAALLLVTVVVGALFLKGGVNWYTSYRMEREIHEVALAKAQLDLALVQPDANGLLPVARQLLASGAVTNQVLMLAAQHVANHAPVQPVPQTITYSPHIAYKNDVNATSQAAAVLPANVQPNDFWSLYSGGKLPSSGFLMGYNLEDGQPVLADWKQLYSALIGGQSGSGKSTLIRNVLAQSALQGGRFVVLDPHFGAGEESLGASLMPLRSLMPFDVAANEKTMMDALRFVFDVGQRRLSGQDRDETPLVLVVDETTALLQRSNVAGELLRVLGQIAQETRKRSVYAMCIGQQFHSEFFDTTVRNSFVSQLSTRARRDVARTQTGNNLFAKEVETLTIGQAVWMQPDGAVVKIAVPNTTAQHIWQVGQMLQNGPKTQAAGLLEVEPLTKPLIEPLTTPLTTGSEGKREWCAGLSAKQQNAIQMYLNGVSKSQIVAELWGAKGGPPFQAASAEFDEALRQALAGRLS